MVTSEVISARAAWGGRTGRDLSAADGGSVRTASGGGVEVEEVTTSARFAALQPAWDRLFAQAETASPFNTWLWLATWWEVFGQGKQLRIVVVWEDERAIAVAPFYTLHYRLGPLRVRAVLPMGYGNDLTERMEMLVAAGRRADAIRSVAAHLAARRQDQWDLLLWSGVVRAEMPVTLQRLVHRERPMPHESRPVPTAWPELVGGLSKSMRDNLTYYPRLLARHGHAVHTRIVTAPQDLGPALAEFVRLHRARAHCPDTIPHDDRFGVPAHHAFLQRIAPLLAAQSMLRLTLLSVDHVTVAAQLTLEHAGTLYVYYSGFDPCWRRYGVGMQATAACLQDALTRGVRTVDFLGGTVPFKRQWGTRAVPLGKVILLRDAVPIHAAFAAYTTLQHVCAHVPALRSSPGHGITRRHRVLRRISALLRQPLVG